MKKTLILAASLLIGTAAQAELSPKLEKEIDSKTATAIYNAMDRFVSTTDNDAISEITYDCWNDGLKEISRRIDIDLNPGWVNKRKFRKGFDEFCEAYDAAAPQCENIREITERSSIRAYKCGAESMHMMHDGKGEMGFSGYHEGALATLKNYQISIAQTLSFKTAKPDSNQVYVVADSLQNLFNYILKTYHNAMTREVSFVAETKNSGIMRVRSYLNETESTKGAVTYVAGDNAVPIWEKAYDTFMSLLGYDANISLTYKRSSRMLTLYSPENHIVYAACLRDNVFYMFMGGYFGNQPFLPSNWMHAREVKGNVSYYDSEEVESE